MQFPSFGTAGTAFGRAASMRQIQFGLKFLF
jgi:hypothetical protein